MYKLCKTEQSMSRQRQVEQGLLQAMKTQRYEDISVSELCNQIGIPRKSFYRYFSSKDGALFALLDHTMLDFLSMPVNSTSKGGTALGDLDRFFAFWYEHGELLDVLERSSLSGILVERATNLAMRERMMPRYLMPMEAKYQGIALSFAVCGVMSMVIQWHHQGFQETPEDMNRIAMNMLTRPLVPM